LDVVEGCKEGVFCGFGLQSSEVGGWDQTVLCCIEGEALSLYSFNYLPQDFEELDWSVHLGF
jgi:hypothetical protein